MYLPQPPPPLLSLLPGIVHALDEAVRLDLQNRRDLYFSWLIISALVVVIGVFLEGPELYETANVVRRRCLGKSPFRTPGWVKDWAKLLALLGWCFVVLGVTGEVLSERFTSWADGSLQTFNDILLTEARKEAGAAKVSAESAAAASSRAQQQAGEVAVRASKITDRLSKASKQLNVIEDQVALQGPRWRQLEGHRAAFIEALKPFAGQKVTVVRCEQISPPEQVRLEGSLIIYLGKEGAGWDVGYSVWANCHNWAASIGGNVVVFNSAATETVKASAGALAGILNKLKITTLTIPEAPEGRQSSAKFMGVDSPFALAGSDPSGVFILVGINPMYDLAGMSRPHE